MTTTEIITHIEQLQSRAERAEALLADERLRVANLERELAARPVVSEETVQAIAEDLEVAWHGKSYFLQVLRRHLLPATPEPVPQKPDKVMVKLGRLSESVTELAVAIRQEREAGR